jgi:hypothetical protein
MLDPRIYRMGIVPVLLAVIVLAFSLQDQPGALTTGVVPGAFNGASAYATMNSLAEQYSHRPSGSPGDNQLAGWVAKKLRKSYGFTVSTDSFQGPTPHGNRTLENVIGVRAGGGTGSVVIVSSRNASGPTAAASMSGTAVMLELARDLAGQPLNRTLVMVSSTGSIGGVGTEHLLSELTGPIDAVVVLGDLAGPTTGQPVVSASSDGQQVAPGALRSTVASALGAQTGLSAGGSGVPGQLAHLAFPMSTGEQAPIVGGGLPAVLLSLSGEREPSAAAPVTVSRITGMGRTALASLTALQRGPSVSDPSTYLVWSSKVIPAWSIRLLALILILPVLAVTVDGMARARRRGHSISRWIVWVVAAAVPFILAALLVLVAHATGWIGPAPPIPPEAGSWPLGAGGVVLLVMMGLLIVAGLIWLRPLLISAVGLRRRLAEPVPTSNGAPAPGVRRPRDEATAPGAGAAAGVLVVMCAVTLTVWFSNPFAALLLVPALHLWLWVVTPDVRLPVPVTVLMLAIGLAPVALLAAYVAVTLGLGPVGLAWTGVLMLAGGPLSLLGAIEWSLLAGCAISVVVIAVRAQAADRQDLPVTVRGPMSYAGPGSLGGTESALRR